MLPKAIETKLEIRKSNHPSNWSFPTEKKYLKNAMRRPLSVCCEKRYFMLSLCDFCLPATGHSGFMNVFVSTHLHGRKFHRSIFDFCSCTSPRLCKMELHWTEMPRRMENLTEFCLLWFFEHIQIIKSASSFNNVEWHSQKKSSTKSGEKWKRGKSSN